MIIERDKLLCLIVTVIVEFVLVNGNDNHHLPSVINTTNINDHDSGQQEARSLFSPRIDYNEWMPVGRGDPLKNDPTYDYSPPVLDRVRYWGDRDTNKDKKEILLLGVPSKRQTHKKETNHSSSLQYVRRNFYSSHALHHLPTRLIPPPVQTLSPTTKQTSTESYHNLYNHLSNYNSHLNHNWNINSVHYDSHPDESINFISFTRTERPSNLKSSYSNYGQYYTTASRKPWIYELLQKEITKPSSHLSQAIPSTSPPHITPLTPSHSSTYFMTPSKNVFESHTSLQPTSINYVTASFTTEEPEPTYFQPTIPTTSPSPITTSTFSYTPISHKKKEHHEINSIHGPMYLIIQGHSKVKTYGLKDDSANNHQPKIVPIAPKEENIIIKHVTSKDDNGKAVEIKHLHKKTTELPLKEKLKVTTSATTKKSTTISTTAATTNITTTTEEQSPMKNLLSLLDTSFGSFFGFDNEDNNKTAIAITTKKPDTSTNNNINKNCTSATDATTINDIRERRQIFDYDQLPESSIKTDDEYYDYDGTLFASEPKSSSVQIKSELNSTEIV